MRLNIGHFLARRAYLQPDKVGLIADDRRLTFHQMNGRANRLARAMVAQGIRPGDRVAVLLRNCIEYYDIYYGLARIGAVMCGINWRLARPEVTFILADSGARLFIFDQEFAGHLSAIETEVATLEDVIVVGPTSAGLKLRYDDLVADCSEAELAPIGGDDDPLILMYTSGTTGRPKGALLTHRQMFWCSATVIYTLDHRHEDINLLPLPMYHIGGMSFVTIYVHLGATVVLLREWDTARVLALVEQEGINHFMAVPTMLDSILNHPDLERYDLRSLRWLLASAAPVPARLIQAYEARGIVVLQSYGMTETAGPATVTPGDQAIARAGSAGLPFFHTEIRLVDPEGQDVPAGQVGEIWIRGDHLIRGYWQNETATQAAFVDGWFRSGDLARRDAAGYLYIVDRMKDMIISGGENVYPAELEKFLYAHPRLAEVAVIGLPDATWGEIVCAVVVLREGETITLSELQAYCDGHIARFKIPRRLVVLDTALPRNPTGKLLKPLLREQVQAQLEL